MMRRNVECRMLKARCGGSNVECGRRAAAGATRPAVPASTARTAVTAKRARAILIGLAVWCPATSIFAADPAGTAYRVGKVVTMDAGNSVINNAIVLERDGKIEKVGRASEVSIPANYRVVDMPDHWLAPGFVDAHNHTAGSLRDLNDMVYLTNPGLRTLETIVPESELVKQGRAGGVTTVLLIPGSGTNMSGFGTLSKMGGETVEEMVIQSPGSLKIAQAGNPERYWFRVGRTFMNYNTRQTLQKARDYHQKWTAYEEQPNRVDKPEYDPIWHEFRGLFRRDFVVSVHTQMYQVMMTTVDMLTRGFGLHTVLDHCTFDGYKIAPLVNETDAYTINGPRQYHFDRIERRMNGNAARWWQGGVRTLGINTDAPVVPQEELPYQAAMACWYGWQPYAALRGLTIVPAAALKLDQQVGSIEAGKHADFGLWTGDPIDPRSACELTVIGGKAVYDASTERRW